MTPTKAITVPATIENRALTQARMPVAPPRWCSAGGGAMLGPSCLMTHEPPSSAISKRQLLLLVCCSSGFGDGLGDGRRGSCVAEYGGGRRPEEEDLQEEVLLVVVGIGRLLEPAAACDAGLEARENTGDTSSSPSWIEPAVVVVVEVRWCIDIETVDQIWRLAVVVVVVVAVARIDGEDERGGSIIRS